MRKAVTCSLLLFFSIGLQTVKGQSDVGTQVSQAIRLIPVEPQAARKELKKLGAPAFPHILKVIHNDSGLDPIKKAFLVAVIGASRTKEAVSALTDLLSDPDPYVRGLAASYFGRRRDIAARAALVKLLEDKAVYATKTTTDPAAEEPILVRDKAVEALEAITRMKVAPTGTGDEKAKAWQEWWLRQRGK